MTCPGRKIQPVRLVTDARVFWSVTMVDTAGVPERRLLFVRSKGYSTCDRCNRDIQPGDEIVLRHGKWIHAKCAPGGDDE